jgi:hypothetical protein
VLLNLSLVYYKFFHLSRKPQLFGGFLDGGLLESDRYLGHYL